jgi:hypothetical protein
MRNFLANLLLIAVSFVVCLLAAEGAIRIIDGQSVVALALPEVNSSQGVDTTGGHLDEIPRAATVERALFFTDPPPLPNRTVPPREWTDMYRRIEANQSGPNPFLPWDMYKAWNSVFVGDPCKHSYLKGAPGQLYVYDPPDGKPRPFFRFLPNATTPDGLVTNAFGWRGPPVQFQRAARTVRIVFVGASTVAEIHPLPYSGPEYLQNWLNRWAKARNLDVTFEVLNAGRESINSNDIAAIVRQEVAPTMPDFVVYYEGGNELNLATIVKEVPVATPEPAGKVARWLRQAASYSALARRAEGLTSGGEWPKPPYETVWPAGLDEMDPDITRPDLPINLSTIIRNLDSIRTDLDAVGSGLSVASFHWLAKEGLVVDAARQKAIVDTLNIRYFPYSYRDLERMTRFEDRVFAKYDAKYGLPFIDVARYMPYDANLFSDAIHNTPPGIKLRAWIELQQLVPIIEQKLASGAWPRAVPPMPAEHPAFTVPPRLIKFDCTAS